MPIDEDLGLSDRDKELKKWNAPYVYRELPRMLYRGVTVAGRLEVEQRIVGSEGERLAATDTGWWPHPTQAIAAADARAEALSTAAAERAYEDRRLSAAAQADAAAIDQASARHLGEIAERPRRPRSHRKPKKETPS